MLNKFKKCMTGADHYLRNKNRLWECIAGEMFGIFNVRRTDKQVRYINDLSY